MIALICFVLAVLASLFKSKSRLEAENAVLRHQLIVLRRRVRGRAQPTNNDRWFLVPMYRWFPPILKVVTIVQPETLVRWHRAGFRRYWRWKSNSRGGRPRIEIELRALIRHLGGLAEFERELIRTRTGEGRERAKARGVILGRKPKLSPHQRRQALARREAGEVLTDIARTYNVSHSTISRL